MKCNSITIFRCLSCIGLFVIALIIFNSCRIQEPLTRSAPDNNKTYEVFYLFEHDGCKVYRFADQGNWIYFTNCNGEVTSLKGDSAKTRVVNVVRVKEVN